MAPVQLTRIHPNDEDTPILSIPFNVAWKSSWITETNILNILNGKITINKYLQNKAPQHEKTRTIPPTPLPQPGGWHPKYITFTTISIISDLSAAPLGHYEITHSPINRTEALIYAPDGRLITAMIKAKLPKLKNLYQPANDITPSPQAVVQIIRRHKATT
jgi:hypothetical protein